MGTDTTDDLWSRSPINFSNTAAGARPPIATSPARADPDRSAWISKAAKVVFGSYRRDDFANPEIFLENLVTVLEGYADNVIREATSPLSGITRKMKFPPSIAEVVEFCDGIVQRLERVQRFSAMKRVEERQARPPVHPATVFVPTYAPQYAAMYERARRPDEAGRWRNPDDGRSGLWVPRAWLEAVA